MESMKALVKLKPEPGIWMDEIPFPGIGHNDVLIKVIKTAICGTDIHIFNWDAWSRKTIPTPMAIGHEFVGIITEIGSEVRGLKEGDRVSAEGHITCGHCRNLPGRQTPSVPQHHRCGGQSSRMLCRIHQCPCRQCVPGAGHD